MLGIGINEYVTIGSETKINEKGSLELHLKANLSESEVMQQVLQGKEISDGSVKLILFPTFKEDYETKVRKSVPQLMKDIQEYQKVLIEFLKIYLTSEQIEEHFSFKTMLGAAANEEAFVKGMATDTFVDKVYTHVASKFIEVLKKFSLFEHKETFRIKLWRQSAERAFPRIPGGFGKWIESMRIPYVFSAILETEYEKKEKKLNKDAVAPDAVPATETTQQANLFTPGNTEDELPFK